MIESIGPSIEEYDRFIAFTPRGHFMQTRMWGKHKSSWQWKGLLRRDAGVKVTGAFAVMLRRVPGTPYSMMYGCRGPVCDAEDLETARELLEGAKALAKKRRCYILKVDPNIQIRQRGLCRLQSWLHYAAADHENSRVDSARYISGSTSMAR